jgi:hypothetical protein
MTYKQIDVFLLDGSVLMVKADGLNILEIEAEEVKFHDDRYPGE